MFKVLFRPIDSAILVYFRIFAGLLIAQEHINGLVIGKLHEFTAPEFHFSYLYFDWIKPWPLWGMVIHYAVTIFSAISVAFNFQYRFFSTLLFLGHTSLFLMEKTEYINHAYLYSLLSFWMIFLPLNESKRTAPAWTLHLLLFHMALAYFYGGLAKLNPDWLRGTPMDIYLSERADYLLGDLYTWKWSPLLFSYGGLLFDLLIVPLLLIKRTRVFALGLSILFHVSNALMFGLATFPWFSLLLTSMFFDPSWPRKVPVLKKFLPDGGPATLKSNPVVPLVLSFYVLFHVVFPLRHYTYPGVTSWTEDGHMFSWRMMLRNKEGRLFFVVRGKEKSETVNPRKHLTKRQLDDIVGKPELILQYAHFLRDSYSRKWNEDVSVHASARVSLNGRPFQEMIHPGTDLGKIQRSDELGSWVLPLKEDKTLIVEK
jgi:vitamin K-dependent gamma-carboxylase